jgi:hypothetical protein
VIALMIILNSCSKIILKKEDPLASPYAGYNMWLIKKGNHYSENNSYAQFKGSRIQFRTIFDSSAIYTTADKVNQADINKLYGASDAGTHHHENSARFGWRWKNNAVEIFAYYYVNKERKSIYLGNAAIGKEDFYALSVEGNHYVFQFNDKKTIVERYSSAPNFDGYLLYPYFGGDEVAPHDIRIHISNLK